MEEKSNAFLEREPVGKLMGKYAVPCIISLLVAAEDEDTALDALRQAFAL